MGPPDPAVCIVGAGPAGLVTAHLLHQAGVPFVLLERQQADQLRVRVKAGMIEHRTVQLLRRHGLAGPILSGGMRVGQCEFRADGQAFPLDIAIQDAAELAGGLIERYGGRGDGGRLARYTQTRLPHIWRYQEFSNLMLTLFNAGAEGSRGFSYGLRRARLDLVLNDPQFARWFAHTYVGVDE